MRKAVINYYDLLLKLKQYDCELEVIEENEKYRELDVLQTEIKSYIFANNILKKDFIESVRAYHSSLEQNEIKQKIEKIYNEIKVITNKNLEIQIDYSEIRNNIILAELNDFDVIDYPEFFYYPSVILNKLDKHGQLYNKPLTGGILQLYYSIFKKNPMGLEMNNLLTNAAFAFWAREESISFEDERFHFYFLIAAIHQVLKSLQMSVETAIYIDYYSLPEELLNKNFETIKTYKNKKNKPGFTDEEIEILRLRKNLPNNTYKNIGANMSTKLSESNITQKFMKIKNILGANSPDEAVAKFEKAYYSLSDSDE